MLYLVKVVYMIADIMGMEVKEARVTSTAVMSAWGKYDKDTGEYYPLIAHLLDTTAFASAIWHTWMSDRLRGLLAPLFGEQPDLYFAFLAGSHDDGKLEPLFQGGLLWKDRAAFTSVLKELGLDDVVEDYMQYFHYYDGEDRRHLRHESMSAVALADHGIPLWHCAAISGHHGQYPFDEYSLGSIQDYRDDLRKSNWGDAQDKLIDVLANAIGIDIANYPLKELESQDAPMIPLITGLIVLADWLASDEKFRSRPDKPELDENRLDEYLAVRTDQAREVVTSEHGLGVAPRREVSFKQVFGFEPTRDIQKWAVENQDSDGLTVIAVPTGEGKTEAALWLQAKYQSGEGLAFALPTMATADAIFDRVQKFYRDSPALANLAHSRSMLNAFYSASNTNPKGVCGGEDNDDEQKEGLSPGSWFSGRHRALSAPIVVGTCDQLLAASLSHRFLPVRLASLANKHIVLDEVHTYDAYQHRLLVRLLGWMGYYHTRVTILSATLPKQRLVECFQAYESGWQRKDIAIDDLEAVYPGITWTTSDGSHRQQALSARQDYQHAVNVRKVPFDALNDELAEMAHSAWHQSPHRVAVIVNIVSRSQQVMERLSNIQCPECSIGDHLVLLHSRMTANQRAEATDTVLSRAGKSGTEPVLLVSTQIAEASLDVDFDILITDIAPTASLVQRMGRQWRHSSFKNGVWSHPDTVGYRDQRDPEVIVVVPVDEAGSLAAYKPYSRADIFKTLSQPGALDGGKRTVIRIPGEVQRAVDESVVGWDDLTDEDISGLPLYQLEAKVAKDSSRKKQAEDAGRDVLILCGTPDLDEGFTNPHLYELTHGKLFSEERQTRITDYESVELLIIDEDATNPYMYHGAVKDVLDATNTDIVKDIIGYTVRVPYYYTKGLTPIRDKCASPLLCGITIVSYADCFGNFILDDLGLRKIPHA